jgi:hypothetical protein
MKKRLQVFVRFVAAQVRQTQALDEVRLIDSISRSMPSRLTLRVLIVEDSPER